MIKPSEVDIAQRFIGTELRNFEKEVVLRNITVMSQIIAEAKKDDRWHPFSMAEYEGVRAVTSEEPVTYGEQRVIGALKESGHLTVREDGNYSVTNMFLGIVAEFATQKSVGTVIAQ